MRLRSIGPSGHFQVLHAGQQTFAVSSSPEEIGRTDLLLMDKVVIDERLQDHDLSARDILRLKSSVNTSTYLTCKTSLTDCWITPFFGASFSISCQSEATVSCRDCRRDALQVDMLPRVLPSARRHPSSRERYPARSGASLQGIAPSSCSAPQGMHRVQYW